jgi:hypothetical protein
MPYKADACSGTRIILDLHHKKLSAGFVVDEPWGELDFPYLLDPPLDSNRDSNGVEDDSNDLDSDFRSHTNVGSKEDSEFDQEALPTLMDIIDEEAGGLNPTIIDSSAFKITPDRSGQLSLRTLQELCTPNVGQNFILSDEAIGTQESY